MSRVSGRFRKTYRISHRVKKAPRSPGALVQFPDGPRLIEDQGDLVLRQRAPLLFGNKFEVRLCSSLVRCGRASGHAIAPTISVMKSRRFIGWTCRKR